MPRRKTIRFQNRQGQWKSKAINSQVPKAARRSKRLSARQLGQPRQKFVSHRGSAQGNIIPGSLSGHQTVKETGQKKRVERTHELLIDDTEVGTVVLTEFEESSRYTPSNTVDIVDHKDGGKITITKVSPRDKRVVSKTDIGITPSLEKSTKAFDLQERFKKGETLEVRRELIPLADSLGIPTGAPTRSKLERRIRKKLVKGGE